MSAGLRVQYGKAWIWAPSTEDKSFKRRREPFSAAIQGIAESRDEYKPIQKYYGFNEKTVRMIAQLDKSYIRTRPQKMWSRLISYGLFEGRPVTTRGQWINPLVFSLFKVWKVLPLVKKVKRPVFIIGTGRSGTTLLGMVLSMHRQVSFLNEPKALWHEILPQEDLIGSYSSDEAYYKLDEEFADFYTRRRARKLFGAYLSLTRGHRVLDKYPELIFRVPFVKAIFPDALFLFITRDGRDTLQSIDKWSDRLGENHEDQTHDWWGVDDRKWKLLCEQVVPESALLSRHSEEISAYDDHEARAAVEWIVTMEKGLEVSDTYRESVLKIKYEDLLSASSVVLNKIRLFTGLDRDEKMVRYAKEAIEKPAPKEDVTLPANLRPAFNQLRDKLGYT